jgi:hypothetical protein
MVERATSTFHVPFAFGPATSCPRLESSSHTPPPKWILTTPHDRGAQHV